jgi:hypothetical protein
MTDEQPCQALLHAAPSLRMSQRQRRLTCCPTQVPYCATCAICPWSHACINHHQVIEELLSDPADTTNLYLMYANHTTEDIM